MKICFISSIFPPYIRGGAEVVVEATARAFADSGHEVFVITCAPFEGWRSFAGRWETQPLRHPEWSPQGAIEGSHTVQSMGSLHSARASVEMTKSIRIFRFTPLNLFTIFNISKYPPLLRLIWHVLDMFNLHTYLVARRILREQKPDLVITRNLKGLGFTVPLAIRQWIRPPLHPPLAKGGNGGVWLHGLHDLNALHPRGFMEYGREHVIRKPNPLVRIYRVVARRLLGSPDVVIAPSQFVLEEYERAGFFPESKKVVIGNPIVPPLGGGTPPPSGGTSFLFLGQLESYKGLRVLLQAWQKFVATHPQATLEIVGQGNMEEELRRTAQMIPGIALRGFVPHEKLPEIFAGATATILPSLAYETFGMSAAESLAHGVPVICSRLGALKEIVQDGVNGILVPPGNAEALKQAMEQVLRAKFIFSHFPLFTPLQYCQALEKLMGKE